MPWKQVTIERPFDPACLHDLLDEGARGSLSRYTHFDIIDWARRYAEELQKSAPLNGDDLLLWQILDDMTIRWELYIAGTYSIEQMKRFSHVDILLPKTYFQTWMHCLDNAGEPKP